MIRYDTIRYDTIRYCIVRTFVYTFVSFLPRVHFCVRLSSFASSFSSNGVATETAIGLIIGGTESCIGIANIRHFRVIEIVIVALGIFWNGGCKRSSSHSRGRSNRWCCCCCTTNGSLYKAALDSQSSIGKILSAIVSNLFVPDPAGPFALESSNDGRSFGRCVDSDAPVFVVYLFVFPE